MEIEVDVDHIHLIASIPLTMAPSKALNLIKGFSAYLLFKIVPNLRLRYRKGHLWSKGKFAASLGFVQVEVVNEYVRNQDEHHGTVWIMEE